MKVFPIQKNNILKEVSLKTEIATRADKISSTTTLHARSCGEEYYFYYFALKALRNLTITQRPIGSRFNP